MGKTEHPEGRRWGRRFSHRCWGCLWKERRAGGGLLAGGRTRDDQRDMTVGTAWSETVLKFTIVHYKAQMRMYTIQESP
jgi:hypothetical protein